MNPEEWHAFRQEWRKALPDIIAGKPDRTDFMLPLNRILEPGERQEPPLSLCLSTVARIAGYPVAALVSERRERKLSRARALAAVVMRDLCPRKSYPQIGRAMDKHHASIMHAERQGRERLKADLDFFSMYREAMRLLS